MTNQFAEETIGIDTSGESVTVELDGRTICEVAIRGDASASYRVDGREHDSATWKTGTMGNPQYTGSSDYDDTIESGWHELRITCSSGTAGSNDEATITLCAGGK